MPPRWMQSKLSKMRRAKRTYPKWIRSGGVDPTKAQAYDIFNNQQRVRSAHGRSGERLPDMNNTFMNVDAAVQLDKLRQQLRVANANGNTKEHNAINKRIRELEKIFAPPPKEIVDPDDPWDYYVDEDGNERRRPNKVPRETVKPEWYELELQRKDEARETHERSERTFVRNELCRCWSGERGQGITRLVGTTIEAAGEYALVLYFSGQEFVFVQTVGEDRWVSKTYTRQSAYDAHEAGRIAWVLHEKVPTDT